MTSALKNLTKISWTQGKIQTVTSVLTQSHKVIANSMPQVITPCGSCYLINEQMKKKRLNCSALMQLMLKYCR